MKKQNESFGIVGFILSIIGLASFIIFYIGIIFSILAIIFTYKQNKKKETSLSNAGFIMGIIGTIINGLALLFLLVLILFIYLA